MSVSVGLNWLLKLCVVVDVASARVGVDLFGRHGCGGVYGRSLRLQGAGLEGAGGVYLRPVMGCTSVG